MTMRSLRSAVAVLLAVAVVPAAAAVKASSGPSPAAVADPTIGPLESGTTSYHNGAFVWTDYAYDDTGPNTATGTPGAATYPSSQDQSNAADLIQLQARLDRSGNLVFRAVLETLTNPSEPLLGIGLDTDSNVKTGAASVPGGRWHNPDPLGIDDFVRASVDVGRLQQWTGTRWAPGKRLTASVDPAANTITVTIPASVLARRHAIRAVAVLGLDRSNASWFTGNGPIFDLAFVRGEDPTSSGNMLSSAEQVALTGQGHATGGQWQDRRQADVLVGHLPGRAATATLNLAAMRAHRTAVPSLMTAGYHAMLYRSQVALPEGIVDGTAGGGLWAGPYQPYVVQLPAHPKRDMPTLVWLHGGGQNHLDNGTFEPQGPMSIGRSVAVFPYGREPTTANEHGYSGVSEQDALDALRSAQQLFGADIDRTIVGGVSTGGGGASRMAQLHPDLFSGVLIMSAYDDTHLPENLINMPVVFQNGGADPAASQPVLALTLQEFDHLHDIDYRSYTIAAHSHADPVAPLTQCLLNGLLATTIVRSPARVVLGLDPHNDPNPAPAGLELRHGDAYWLHDVIIRPGAPTSTWHTAAGDPPGYGDNVVAQADVTSHAFAHRSLAASPIDSVGQNITAGATLCDANHGPTTNDIWRIHGTALTRTAAQPTGNAADLALRNLEHLTMDLARMQLKTTQQLTLHITGDGTTTLDLAGSWSHTAPQVTDNGAPIMTATVAPGHLVMRFDLSGTHTVVITPV